MLNGVASRDAFAVIRKSMKLCATKFRERCVKEPRATARE
jgi:hypothetical protein